jgi:hypothetical protein
VEGAHGGLVRIAIPGSAVPSGDGGMFLGSATIKLELKD